MSKKILTALYGLSVVAGFLLIFVTAGASDLSLIDFKTILVGVGIGLLLVLIGFVGLKANNWEYIY